MHKYLLHTVVICSFLSAGCKITPTPIASPTSTPEPTATPVPTRTLTATSTPTATATSTTTSTATSTSTKTAKPTSTITPTPACLASNGKWDSLETNQSGYPGHILTFTVSNCQITSWEIWTYPLPGELLFWTENTPIPITGDQFTHAEATEGGTFTLAGAFNSANTSHGTLYFPKGFSVFGTIVPKDVTIRWTAIPTK